MDLCEKERRWDWAVRLPSQLGFFLIFIAFISLQDIRSDVRKVDIPNGTVTADKGLDSQEESREKPGTEDSGDAALPRAGQRSQKGHRGLALIC